MSLEGAIRYNRPLEVDTVGDPVPHFARRIPPNATVLDIGCGPGVLGRLATALKPCLLDGIEIDPEAAQEARRYYRDVRVADLGSSELAELLPGRRYDIVICADVLEHLEAPGRMLRQIRRILAPGGRLLISLPHVGYAGIVAELLTGRFRYRPSGLLDRTHLRFFTRAELTDTLTMNGFAVADFGGIVKPVHESEFGHVLDRLAPAMREGLLTAPDALIYQFLVEAVPGRSAVMPAGADWSQALLQSNRPEESLD